MAETVNIYDAKARLSQLIAQVEAGEIITLARNGKPVALLTPLGTIRPDRVSGSLKGMIVIAEGFDDLGLGEDEQGYGE
ncbi:type II toxin-antitoxin system Phd/YefM family antitoxin [Nakamurella antarctica]|uniref:Antitoxin n=1 Tax=Nakamurella antarctica TaxID=1902245 RepID=A0A3G8ZSJ4_9ACTN|nr:type II toxin-antitoxin system prevent-host-death family antitoxin [Nakamurella antarctica]AZI57474.1 type II toxin-antitoxin system Phd/YefM family antitoxin [Nakamurella antarctica]